MAEKELKVKPKKLKILFISQEISPFTSDSEIGSVSRNLSQAVQELGREIRIMMPRFGLISERSHHLHEVFRLSNTYLTINDDDKPLLLRVAPLQASKMQIYFIYNEELFKRKHIFRDEDKTFYKDNDERMIFFCRGVLETVKQLNWSPDIIHCHGWMTSLVPLLIKTTYKKDPLFSTSKVIYTLYNDDFTESLDKDYQKKLTLDGIAKSEMKELEKPTFESITKNAISKSDGVIIGSADINPMILDYLKTHNIPVLQHQPSETFINETNNFYEGLSTTLVK